MGGDRNEILIFPVRALRKYLTITEQYCLGISVLFVSVSQRKKRVS